MLQSAEIFAYVCYLTNTNHLTLHGDRKLEKENDKIVFDICFLVLPWRLNCVLQDPTLRFQVQYMFVWDILNLGRTGTGDLLMSYIYQSSVVQCYDLIHCSMGMAQVVSVQYSFWRFNVGNIGWVCKKKSFIVIADTLYHPIKLFVIPFGNAHPMFPASALHFNCMIQAMAQTIHAYGL